MDKFGNVYEVGFDGQMGDEDLAKTAVLAAYQQPINAPILEQAAATATPAPLASTQAQIAPSLAPSTSTVKIALPASGLASFLKNLFVRSSASSVPQSQMNVAATKAITAQPTEYTVTTEKFSTPSTEVAPESQTTLQPTVVTKLTGLSRAAQVKAIAEARKSGKVKGKELTEEEKSVLTRHPFLDIMKR